MTWPNLSAPFPIAIITPCIAQAWSSLKNSAPSCLAASPISAQAKQSKWIKTEKRNPKKLYNLVYGKGYFRCCFSRLDGRNVQLGGKKRLVGKKYVSSWKNFSS
jgi:hypothetical protein